MRLKRPSMTHRKSKYLMSALMALFLLLGLNGDALFLSQKSRQISDSMGFCRPLRASESRPIILSTDEKINVEVFEKVHPAVVNIVTTMT